MKDRHPEGHLDALLPLKRNFVAPKEYVDPDARKVVRRLQRHGHEAYLVGGCVRDLLLNRAPKDFDVATSATPDEIRALFRNCRIIGRRFRLAHIFFGPKIIETSTFRANPHQSDDTAQETHDEETAAAVENTPNAAHHDPCAKHLLIRRDNVFGSAEQDAWRRDFTINALFYNPDNDQIIDFVGGLSDIEGGVIRTIGDPEVRLPEDPVRILRAIKFSARLKMRIDAATHDAMFNYRQRLEACPMARVLEEIRRLLAEGYSRRCFDLLASLSVLEILLPEVADALQTVKAGEIRSRLEGMDRVVNKKNARPTRALLFANLLVGTLNADWMEQRDLSRRLRDALRAPLHRLQVPRKDKDTIIKILIAQRRFMPGASRRRFRSLLHTDYFSEALQLYELGCLSGQLPDRTTLERWKTMAGWSVHDWGPPPQKNVSKKKRTKKGRRRNNSARGKQHRPKRYRHTSRGPDGSHGGHP